jgi:hypothetical protein
MTWESGILQHLRWIDECWQRKSVKLMQRIYKSEVERYCHTDTKGQTEIEKIHKIQKETCMTEKKKMKETFNEAIKLKRMIHKLY